MKIYYTILAVLTMIISVIIFWAEFSTFISVFNKINILSLINWSSPAAYLMNCCLTLYIVYVATHTVFRIKLYRIFSLHKKNSSSSSLCFTCINLARISFPLCYNYLQITNMPKTEFLNFFGDINYGSKVAFLFPVLMIFFGVCNLLDIYDKIMGYLGLGSYAFDEE